MIKVLLVFGTRPEVIKMAPVLKELNRYPAEFHSRVCVTGQHRQMIEPLLDFYNIRYDYDLHLMEKSQSLEHITISVLRGMKQVIEVERPEFLLVQGDTTTAMAGSLAAFYQRVKVAHIEAGLRTRNIHHPYPEEVNRKIIDTLSDLYFAHTEEARQNLIAEGVEKDRIEVTGNTVIDALLDIVEREFDPAGSILDKIPWNGKKVILVTAHRRENLGIPLMNICTAIRTMALTYASDLCFVCPVHLNPIVQNTVRSLLGGIENVFLTEPLDYVTFVQLMKRSYVILTDSGGLQEEAPSLGKPLLVLRETTERPESVVSGAVEVIGTKTQRIIEKTIELLENHGKYHQMANAINPYGDGKASERIVRRLHRETILKKSFLSSLGNVESSPFLT